MKIPVFILSLCFIPFLSTAQFAEVFNFGPKVGYLSSKFTINKDEFKEQVDKSFQFGAFARFNALKFYVQPEVNYQTRGGIFQRPDSSVEVKETIRISAIEVPLMFGYNLVGRDSPNFRIMAGPVASFVVQKDISLSPAIATSALTEDNLNDMNWGVQAGIGVDVLFLTIDVRYEYGINNIYKNLSVDKNMVIRNNLLNVSVGVKF